MKHLRWAPDCALFRPPVGPDTQYLTDYHRGESCPACGTASIHKQEES